jgi:hypothetical protein
MVRESHSIEYTPVTMPEKHSQATPPLPPNGPRELESTPASKKEHVCSQKLDSQHGHRIQKNPLSPRNQTQRQEDKMREFGA